MFCYNCRCDGCYVQRLALGIGHVPVPKNEPSLVPIPLNITPGKWVQRDGGIADVFAVRGDKAFGADDCKNGRIWDLDGQYVANVRLPFDLIHPAPKTRDV